MPSHYNKKFRKGGKVDNSSGGGRGRGGSSNNPNNSGSNNKPSTGGPSRGYIRTPQGTNQANTNGAPKPKRTPGGTSRPGPTSRTRLPQPNSTPGVVAGVIGSRWKNHSKIKKHKIRLTSDTPIDEEVPDNYTGGGGGGYSPVIQNQELPSIKIPEKDNVLSLTNVGTDAAEITALIFEKLGAVELTKFTRTDTVEGNNPYYNIISNLSSIRKEFDPSNLVSSQKSDNSLYNAFSIRLSTKIPGEYYLEERSLDNYIFIDNDGSLVIELINITQDELVEIEIDTNGTIIEVRQ